MIPLFKLMYEYFKNNVFPYILMIIILILPLINPLFLLFIIAFVFIFSFYIFFQHYQFVYYNYYYVRVPILNFHKNNKCDDNFFEIYTIEKYNKLTGNILIINPDNKIYHGQKIN
jgi:hypothetical protein